MSAIGGFFVAMLNRRSSIEGESTKRLEMILNTQQGTLDRYAQTIHSLEEDMNKLRREWAAEREEHHNTRRKYEELKLYNVYAAAEVARVASFLLEHGLQWPPPEFKTFDTWKENLPRDSPPV
ncbi:hypothetical protein [Corynebacterium aquilae]|uniref:hypothetical protein n=1 Tax=Corynebacterium aquilae TaxID=203263 RepID=UPI0012ED4B3C|nr:hypothetical protein [Corynebacterium aquilae]